MQLAAILSALLGFAWLALAIQSHWRQVFGSAELSRRSRQYLRLFGAIALAASGVLCFIANRPSMAILVWIMLLAVTAPLIALTLTWRPKLLRILWRPPTR